MPENWAFAGVNCTDGVIDVTWSPCTSARVRTWCAPTPTTWFPESHHHQVGVTRYLHGYQQPIDYTLTVDNAGPADAPSTRRWSTRRRLR